MVDNKAAEQAALEEMSLLLDQTRPKHIGTGISSGIGYILAGAVGACGIAVLSPQVAATKGAKKGGLVGGVVGGLGGAVAGAFNAANAVGGGVVSGVGQIVRGVAATPSALLEPRRGKWWNDAEGKWIYTNLDEDRHWLTNCPDDDGDILMVSHVTPSNENHDVKDPFYYNALGVDPSVTTSVIKRQYHILARKFSPDRAGQTPEATKQFRDIGHAFFILSDEEMRAKYDKFGMNFMTVEDDHNPPLVDPLVLYCVLYGSEKFEPYFGRLAAATSATVGDSPTLTLMEARTLQKRRVTRLALQLAEGLEDFTNNLDGKIAKAKWMAEGDFLVKASYGYELLQVVGKVYTMSAIQFLGSIESGIGLPSVSNWSKKQLETMRHTSRVNTAKALTLAGDMDKMTLEAAVKESALHSAMTDDERKVTEKVLNEQVGEQFLQFMWKTTVVDITNTIHEAAQMVLYDQSVSVDTRKQRGLALQLLGELFMAQPIPEGPNFDRDGQQSYEEVAFSAMLETIMRKEKSFYMARAETDVEEIE